MAGSRKRSSVPAVCTRSGLNRLATDSGQLQGRLSEANLLRKIRHRETWVGRLGSSSFDVYQEIWQEGEHCATGTTTMVHFNYNTQKAEPVPDAVREKMQNWLKD